MSSSSSVRIVVRRSTGTGRGRPSCGITNTVCQCAAGRWRARRRRLRRRERRESKLCVCRSYNNVRRGRAARKPTAAERYINYRDMIPSHGRNTIMAFSVCTRTITTINNNDGELVRRKIIIIIVTIIINVVEHTICAYSGPSF